MNKLIKKVRDPKDSLITYEVVSSHPIGDPVSICEGVETERLADNEEGTIFFRVTMNKGSLIASSHHDCVEDMVLYKGEIIEVISGTTLNDTKILRINKMQAHSIYAVEDSTFYAQLYKPQTK